MSDSEELLSFNPFKPVSPRTKERFQNEMLKQQELEAEKIKEESRLSTEKRLKEEAKRNRRKAHETKRLAKEELERRISLLLPEELTADEREYLRGLDALDAGWGYGLHTGVSIEDMTHDSAHDLQKYSDIVFRIIDNLKRKNMFNKSDIYSKLPQIDNVDVLEKHAATRATELMLMALKKPGFQDELTELATKRQNSFQFKIISDAARALIHISNREYKRAFDLMIEDKSLRAEYVAVNELKSKQASPKRRKTKSGSSGGKLTRKAYFRKIR